MNEAKYKGKSANFFVFEINKYDYLIEWSSVNINSNLIIGCKYNAKYINKQWKIYEK